MQGGVKKPTLLCKGTIEVVDSLGLIPVELGGNPEPPVVPINELGRRLLKASLAGNIEEIKWLMNKGAPFTADWLGTSPLHYAAQNNYLSVCELLLRAGISKDARTKVDRTPLHMAAAEGHLEILKCLLQYRADIECRDMLEMTPLHWAVQNGHVEIVSFLVSEGAQIDVSNKFNLSPLEIAMQCGRFDIVEILKTHVSDPMIAAQNLAIQLNEFENSNDGYTPVDPTEANSVSASFLETIDLDSDNERQIEYSDALQDIVEDENQNDCITEDTVQQLETNMQGSVDTNDFSDSIKLLQEHGITMLPADDTNILSSVLELGRSVVLTDIGKEVLNSTKPVDSIVINQPTKNQPLPVNPKIITVSAEEFLAMASNQSKLKQNNGKLLVSQKPKRSVKRIIMKKNKLMSFGKVTKVYTTKHDNIMDVKMLINELSEARSLMEEYKEKYLKVLAENEKYKQHILMLTRNKN